MTTCGGTTKKGAPCRGNAVTGTDRCIAHSDRETQRIRGFGGSQARAGRPPLPKPTDLARELVERHVVAILRPHFRALGLELADDGSATPIESGGAKLFGTSRDGVVRPSDVEDLGAQIAASEKLLDRVYGKPKVSAEVSGPAGEPVPIVQISRDPQRAAVVDQILVMVGASRSPSGRLDLSAVSGEDLDRLESLENAIDSTLDATWQDVSQRELDTAEVPVQRQGR